MSSQSFSFGASPSVSKERWLKHAVHKMSRGYNLIVNKDRKVANFYKGFGDFESCSYQTARKLILHDYVELIGEHEMGLEYRLKSDKNIEVGAVAVEEDEEDTDEVGIDTEDAIEEDEDLLDDDELENSSEEDEDEGDIPRKRDEDDFDE